jgi:uncharacterized membrane protein (UPF0127 family)
LTKLHCNSKLIKGRVKEARGFFERSLGLIGRKSIEEDFFLLFRRCNSIHTFFMRFPIDAVMTDKSGVVLAVAEDLRPWRLAFLAAASDTIEMKAGAARKYGIKTGDIITFS